VRVKIFPLPNLPSNMRCNKHSATFAYPLSKIFHGFKQKLSKNYPNMKKGILIIVLRYIFPLNLYAKF